MRTMSGGPCLHYDCSNRNSFGYCRTTVCINEHYQHEQWGLPSTTNKPESLVKKHMTNADKIRAMSDEELADEILRWFNWLNAVEWDDKCIIEWMKQEATECARQKPYV